MSNFVLRRCFATSALLWATLLAGTVPADEAPAVKAALEVSPEQVTPGDGVELQLKLIVNAPWHVYGQISGDGGQQPMNMRLKLPEGIQAVDKWIWPKTAAVLNAGEHVLRQKLRVTALSVPAEVTVMLSYQACNPQLCLPVEMVELSVELKPATRSAGRARRGPRVQGD